MRNLKEKLKKIAKTEELRKEKERERKKDYFSKEGKKRKLGSSDGQAFGKSKRV